MPLKTRISSRPNKKIRSNYYHQIDFFFSFFIDRDDVFSAKFLLNHSTKVNTKRTFDENTPLHLAAQHPDMSPIAQILLEQGASTNAINIDGL